MYIMIKTRSNIAYTISILSRFETNSNKTYLIVAKYVLRYLKETFHLRIIYEENDVLIDYIDVDWVDDQKTRRFTRDYLFTLYENVVNWSSKHQATIALSSCEVEYMTQTQIAKKVLWLRRLINELNLNEIIIIFINTSVRISIDKQSAIAFNDILCANKSNRERWILTIVSSIKWSSTILQSLLTRSNSIDSWK